MPLFLRLFKHLLPRAAAWSITVDKVLRRYFDGLSGLGLDTRDHIDDVYGDLHPSTTRELDEWESQFDLRFTDGLTEQERRDRLDGAWKALGGQSPRYLQDVLQNAGFDVYVHEWFDEADRLPVGTAGCIPARDPRVYVGLDNGGGYTIECGEPLAEAGAPEAELGASVVNGTGYFVVNNQRQVLVPDDTDCHRFFAYVGAATFGDDAQVPATRQAELEYMCLKYFPAGCWVVLFVEYV